MKSKKTLIVLAVAILLLAGALFYFARGRQPQAAPAAAPEAAATAAQNAATAAPVPEETLAPETALAPASEQETNEAVNKAAEAMLPVMDAGVLALRDSENGMYDGENAEFIWSVLYYLCVNNELDSDLITTAENGEKMIPYKLMQELASACFASYQDLPELPKDMKSVTYDEGMDAFVIAPSDRGDTKTEIMRVVPLAEQGYSVYLALLSETEPDAPLISTYVFELAPNSYIDGITGPLFPMSVRMGMNASNVAAQITKVEGDANDITLHIHHVQVYWRPNEEDAETYEMTIVADTQPDETMKLRSTDVVDWNTIYSLMEEKEADFKDTKAAYEWFRENYAKLIGYDAMVYQMRAYDGVIYEMTPLYQFYFAG